VQFHNYQQLTAWVAVLDEKLAFGNSSLLGNASVFIDTDVMKQYAASNFENSKDGSSYACNLKYESSILPLREHEISQACSGLANQEISNVI